MTSTTAQTEPYPCPYCARPVGVPGERDCHCSSGPAGHGHQLDDYAEAAAFEAELVDATILYPDDYRLPDAAALTARQPVGLADVRGFIT